MTPMALLFGPGLATLPALSAKAEAAARAIAF